VIEAMDGPPFMLDSIVNNIKKFRDTIFSRFSFRRHATMERIDALSATSVPLALLL